ncbi:MAG: radical SAM protein [Deltaproteobacteria bacterium]|nr:radical SAM protein [Deltaproteobacteria bacterium]
MLRECRLCPRYCGVNRLEGETGYCGAGGGAKVAAVSVHHGEEPPISGTRGSGTVFFSHCNMACLFCQNFPISQMGVGKDLSAEDLGDRLLELEKKGVHNVNFVTPTPHVPQMIAALEHAREKGFALPVVYNTNGYDSMETLSLLDGIVDIYLPDMKYGEGELSGKLSGTPDYAEHNSAAIEEMFRQVGPFSKGRDGIASRGVLVRHLVLPGKAEETGRVLSSLRRKYGRRVPLSLMGQYFPAYRAMGKPGFDRKLLPEEYDSTILTAKRMGLTNVYIQEL